MSKDKEKKAGAKKSVVSLKELAKGKAKKAKEDGFDIMQSEEDIEFECDAPSSVKAKRRAKNRKGK